VWPYDRSDEDVIDVGEDEGEAEAAGAWRGERAPRYHTRHPRPMKGERPGAYTFGRNPPPSGEMPTPPPPPPPAKGRHDDDG
jgi:hypothetical protein